MLDRLTNSDFSAHLNERFHLSDGSTVQLDAELAEVSLLGPNVGSDESGSRRKAFSIMFLGPKEPLLAQGICQVKHEEMGSFDIFLVPIGPSEDLMRYEAIFA